MKNIFIKFLLIFAFILGLNTPSFAGDLGINSVIYDNSSSFVVINSSDSDDYSFNQFPKLNIVKDENKAYFDILRTWKAYDLKNNRFVDAFTFQNESGVTFKKQYLNWPIPSIEINTNPNLNPQNEGWS